jgi:hypothetical protein
LLTAKSSNGTTNENVINGIDAAGGLTGGFCQYILNNAVASFDTLTTENANRRGMYFIQVNAPGAVYAIVHSDGSTLTSIAAGSEMSIGTSGTAGKINVYLSGGVLTIKNLWGSDRLFNILHLGFR